MTALLRNQLCGWLYANYTLTSKLLLRYGTYFARAGLGLMPTLCPLFDLRVVYDLVLINHSALFVFALR